MKAAWLTDIHFNVMTDRQATDFLDEINKSEVDCFLVTGDIAEANNIIHYLDLINRHISKPVYYVLGNHDFYMGSFNEVYEKIEKWEKKHPCVKLLDNKSYIILTEKTALAGDSGWADGRYGNYSESDVMLRDYLMIDDFANLEPVNIAASLLRGGMRELFENRFLSDSKKKEIKQKRYELMNELGDRSAEHYKNVLTDAFKIADKVILLMHIPPFTESARHAGKKGGPLHLPHFSNKAAGDAICGVMEAKEHAWKHLTVLCGHTHEPAEYSPMPGITVKTGGARYGKPKIEEILDI